MGATGRGARSQEELDRIFKVMRADRDLTTPQLAQRFGLSSDTIRAYRKLLGIPAPPRPVSIRALQDHCTPTRTPYGRHFNFRKMGGT